MALRDHASASRPLPDKDYFTPGEIAKFFGVTSRTVGNWCASGRLPYIKTPSGHRRIPASAVKGGRETLATWEALQARLSLKTQGRPMPTEQEIADQVLTRRGNEADGAAET